MDLSEINTTPDIAPLALSIDQTARALGIGRTGTLALLKSGELQSFKIGHRTLIRPCDIQAFINKRF
jgi:excisionase family DNA binding protein